MQCVIVPLNQYDDDDDDDDDDDLQPKKLEQKSIRAGALLQIQLEELTVLPVVPPSWWGGDSLPLSYNPTLRALLSYAPTKKILTM